MIVLVPLLLAIISAQGAVLHGGTSINSRSDDGHGNYAFNYDIVDPVGAKNGRYEEGDAYGNKRGFYHITDIDGRSRRVDYIADEHGFRAFVQTNEPGTATSEPAGVTIESSQDKTARPAPPPVIVAEPKPIEEVYTPPIIPETQTVRLAVPFGSRLTHTVAHDAPPSFGHSTILPVSRPPISYSYSNGLLPVTTTTTRIVPAPQAARPIISYHSRLGPVAPSVTYLSSQPSPYALSETYLNSPYANTITSRPTFVSLPIIPRSPSHHSYFPIR